MFFKLLFMASDGSEQDARYALSKLLQMGTVAEYEKSFFRSRIIDARFKDENNQAVDTNIGDTAVKDKQEVKKADDQEIKNIKDEEGKIVEDQEVSEVDDDTNNDDFGCLLPPHKGVDLTAEEVGYNKADGKWEPARRIEDGCENCQEAKAFNLLARNFRKFFRKGKRFRRGNRFGNGANRFEKGRSNSFEDKGGESSKKKGECCNCEIEGHFAVKKLVNNKEVVERCQKCVVHTQEVNSLMSNVFKLQDEALSFLNFKESSIALDDMLSRQKLSQDKGDIGFSKDDKTTSVCLKCDISPGDWIADSGCTKHMTGNRRMFTSYKAYDDGHVVFVSNLKGKVVGGEDGVTRLKKYSELSSAEATQADYNVKATNIILQALPLEIYALVSMHKVAKDLWERIQMLMQGTSLTKQERECKLYDAFDKFAYQKGETLRDFYLRFSLLLNDINMYNMKLE
nr:integrase, catalytic region, zinc finger, CCHC-type, peptidase aspartic, catalytic [Tanacetum cinerariifolium]